MTDKKIEGLSAHIVLSAYPFSALGRRGLGSIPQFLCIRDYCVVCYWVPPNSTVPSDPLSTALHKGMVGNVTNSWKLF